MKTPAILLALLVPAAVFAQSRVGIRPQRASTEAIVSPMFRLDPRMANHSLSAYLPGDALLIIESQGLSYWPAKTELTRIAQLAQGAVRGVQDSFRSATSEKCVAIHLPMDEAVQTIQYTENISFSNLIMRSGTAQAALKAGFDTVRVLKTYGMKEHKKDSARPQQIQYTFVLKSLADFESIATSEELLEDVARTMDSVVAVRKRRWGRDDAWFHSLEVVYQPATAPGNETRLTAQRGYDPKGNRGALKGFEAAVAVDVTLLNDVLSPGIMVGFGYRWPKRSRLDEFRFLRLSNSILFHFNQQAVYNTDTFTSMNTASILNLEFGSVFNRPNTLLPLYRASFGVGWCYPQNSYDLVQNTHPLADGAVRIFFTYSASKLITIVPQMFIGGNNLAPYTIGVRFGL